MHIYIYAWLFFKGVQEQHTSPMTILEKHPNSWNIKSKFMTLNAERHAGHILRLTFLQNCRKLLVDLD